MDEDDDVPLAVLSLLNKGRTHAEEIEEEDYVTVVYGKQWYPVVVTGVKGYQFDIMYMKPCRGHFKWGLPNYGTVQREEILLKITEPQQQGKLWKLSAADQRTFKEFISTPKSMKRLSTLRINRDRRKPLKDVCLT